MSFGLSVGLVVLDWGGRQSQDRNLPPPPMRGRSLGWENRCLCYGSSALALGFFFVLCLRSTQSPFNLVVFASLVADRWGAERYVRRRSCIGSNNLKPYGYRPSGTGTMKSSTLLLAPWFAMLDFRARAYLENNFYAWWCRHHHFAHKYIGGFHVDA